MPEGWKALTDRESGRTYYSNRILKTTQWQRPAPPPPVPQEWEGLLRQLVGMGFRRPEAAAALRETKGDLLRAVEKLTLGASA